MMEQEIAYSNEKVSYPTERSRFEQNILGAQTRKELIDAIYHWGGTADDGRFCSPQELHAQVNAILVDGHIDLLEKLPEVVRNAAKRLLRAKEEQRRNVSAAKPI